MGALVRGWVVAVTCALGCSATVRATDASMDDERTIERVDVPSVPDRPPTGIDALVVDAPGFDAPDVGAPDVGVSDVGVSAPMDVANDRIDVPGDDHLDAGVAPSGGRCEVATELRGGEILTSQSLVRGTPGTLRNCDGSPSSNYYERWYRVTVPANTILEVDVANEGTERTSLAMRAFAECEASSCLANTRFGLPIAPLMFHNDGATPRTVRVVLSREALPFSVGLTFTVAARFHVPAPNRTCATALPLAGDVTLRDQNLGATAHQVGLCAGSSILFSGVYPLYYSARVPPRTAFVVSTVRRDTSPADVLVRMHPACGGTGCLPTVPSTADMAQYNNSADTPMDVIAMVALQGSHPSLAVDVNAAFRALPPERVCAAALPLAVDTATRVEHPEDATDPTPRCGADDALLPALHYAITVPPGQALTVTSARLREGENGSFVRLLNGCSGDCLGASVMGSRSTRALFSNTETAARSVVVAVGTVRSSSVSPAEVRATLRPVAANVTCAGALPLTPVTPIRGIDLLEARAPATCTGFRGPVLYYAVQVTTGARLTVEATNSPVGGAGARLSLSDRCGGACLAQGYGTFTYVHRGTAQTLIVAVGESDRARVSGLVDLSAVVE